MSQCFGQIIASRESLRVRLCHECGYAHLDPRPSEEEVAKYYEEDKFYNNWSPPDWLRRELDEHKQGYFNSRYAYETSLFNKNYPLVDVGCGSGHFISYYHYHGGYAFGVEPSRTALRWSQSPMFIYQQQGQLWERVTTPVNIRLTLVLEHIVNPKSFVCGLDRHMSDATRIMVCVPNEFNPLQAKLRRKHGDWFVQPPHINYFSRHTIDTFMQGLGFEVVHRGSTFPIELFALLGKDYIGNDELGHKCHVQRLKFEKMMGPRAFEIYGLLHRKLGWGRDLIHVYKRRM